MKYASWFCAALMALAMVCPAQQKIVSVNMVDLVRFHPSSERDRQLLMDTDKDYQAKIDKQRDQFDQMVADYEKAIKESRNPALNESARQEAEAKATKMRAGLADADRDLRKEIQEKQRSLREMESRLLRQVTKEIREIVTAFAKEKKVDFVVDSTTMAYANPSLDMTDEVLKRMGVDPKKRHEKKAKADKKTAEEKK